jgi:hypothetical protein
LYISLSISYINTLWAEASIFRIICAYFYLLEPVNNLKTILEMIVVIEGKLCFSILVIVSLVKVESHLLSFLLSFCIYEIRIKETFS